VVGYGPFSLSVIHKEILCPNSGDINRPMLMMKPYIVVAPAKFDMCTFLSICISYFYGNDIKFILQKFYDGS
jgi:hypothetical protein